MCFGEAPLQIRMRRWKGSANELFDPSASHTSWRHYVRSDSIRCCGWGFFHWTTFTHIDDLPLFLSLSNVIYKCWSSILSMLRIGMPHYSPRVHSRASLVTMVIRWWSDDVGQTALSQQIQLISLTRLKDSYLCSDLWVEPASVGSMKLLRD